MSVKNPHIIHFLVQEVHYGEVIDKYLCIGACYTTPEKSTTDAVKVTCKNCLRKLKR